MIDIRKLYKLKGGNLMKTIEIIEKIIDKAYLAGVVSDKTYCFGVGLIEAAYDRRWKRSCKNWSKRMHKITKRYSRKIGRLTPPTA